MDEYTERLEARITPEMKKYIEQLSIRTGLKQSAIVRALLNNGRKDIPVDQYPGLIIKLVEERG